MVDRYVQTRSALDSGAARLLDFVHNFCRWQALCHHRLPFRGKPDRAWGRVPQRRETSLIRRTSGTRAGASGNSALPLPWDLTRPPAQGDSLACLRARPLSRFGRSEVSWGQPFARGGHFPPLLAVCGQHVFSSPFIAYPVVPLLPV